MNTAELNGGVLAFIGDAVMSLKVREYLVKAGYTKADELQHRSIRYVSAKGQAAFIQLHLDLLDEAETEIYKRGRNFKNRSVAKNAALADYHAATGFEALWGYWYLTGQQGRIDAIFDLMVAEIN